MKTDRDYMMLDDVKHLMINGLDEKETQILQSAIDKIRKKRNAEFQRSLERAHKIVASWPKWKQNLL